MPANLVRQRPETADLSHRQRAVSPALGCRLSDCICLVVDANQRPGGDHGILPLANYLDAVDQHFAQATPPASPVWNLPTLAWISPHDGFLNILCARRHGFVGHVDRRPAAAADLVLLWGIYLSLFHAGQDFLSFQWDILLLETGFAAIFLAPFSWRSKFLADRHPPRLAIWLLWWILFRLMLESGAVKLTWNTWDIGPDGLPAPNTWKSLTAHSISTTGPSRCRCGPVGTPPNCPSGFKNCRFCSCWQSSWACRGSFSAREF